MPKRKAAAVTAQAADDEPRARIPRTSCRYDRETRNKVHFCDGSLCNGECLRRFDGHEDSANGEPDENEQSEDEGKAITPKTPNADLRPSTTTATQTKSIFRFSALPGELQLLTINIAVAMYWDTLTQAKHGSFGGPRGVFFHVEHRGHYVHGEPTPIRGYLFYHAKPPNFMSVSRDWRKVGLNYLQKALLEREKWYLRYKRWDGMPYIVVPDHFIDETGVKGCQGREEKWIWVRSGLIKRVPAWIWGDGEWCKEFQLESVKVKWEKKRERVMEGRVWSMTGNFMDQYGEFMKVLEVPR